MFGSSSRNIERIVRRDRGDFEWNYEYAREFLSKKEQRARRRKERKQRVVNENHFDDDRD